METNKAPYAIVIKKGTFAKYELKDEEKSSFNLTREEAIKTIVALLEEDDIIVSTTRPHRGAIALIDKTKDGFIA